VIWIVLAQKVWKHIEQNMQMFLEPFGVPHFCSTKKPNEYQRAIQEIKTSGRSRAGMFRAANPKRSRAACSTAARLFLPYMIQTALDAGRIN